MRFIEVNKRRPLFEANIVNLDDIDNFIKGIIVDLHNTVARDWFADKVARFIRRIDDFHVLVTDQNRPAKLPDWAAQAVEANPQIELHLFVPDQNLRARLEHVVDYLNSQPEDSEVWAKLPSASVERVIKQSERWVEEAARQNRGNDANEGVETVLEVGSMRWITTRNIQTVKRDGALLGNCLAQDYHTPGIANGSKTVYILRDASNKPHVALMTVEANPPLVAELKGKGNKPPVGRYIDASREMLNALQLGCNAVALQDVQRMGLIYDSEKHRYGTVTEFTEVVVPNLGRGFQVTKLPTAQGTEFYISRPAAAPVATIIYYTNKMISLSGIDLASRDLVAELVIKFLNTFFGDEAPAPRETQTDRLDSGLASLRIKYDYYKHRYGGKDAVGTRIYERPHFSVSVWGTSEKHLRCTFYDNTGKYFLGLILENGHVSDVETYDTEGNEHLDDIELTPSIVEMLLEFLNKGMQPQPLPYQDFYNRMEGWRRLAGIHYGDGKWGTFAETSTAVHKFRDGTVVRRWLGGYRDPSSDTTYYRFLDGDAMLYEIAQTQRDIRSSDKISGSGRIGPEFPELSPKRQQLLRQQVIEFLNTFSDTKHAAAEELVYDVGFEIVHGGKGWGDLRDVAESVLDFDDGHQFLIYDGNHGKKNIALSAPTGEMILSLLHVVISANSRASTFKIIDANKAKTAGKYLLELYKKISFVEMPAPTASYFHRENDVDQNTFKLGVVFDRGQWKLLQKAKPTLKGDGYQVVNFRNRVAFVDDDGGIIGVAHKESRRGDAFNLASLNAFSPWATDRDLIKTVLDACERSDLYNIITPARHDRAFFNIFGKNGFVHDPERGVVDVEKVAPPRVITKFQDGWEWRLTPYSKQWYDITEHNFNPSGRYGLFDGTGEMVMYVTFDVDGYPEKIRYERIAERHIHNAIKKSAMVSTTGHALSKDDMGPLLPRFLKLLEAEKLKLSPVQAKELDAVVGADGRVRSLSSDPMLKQYMDGKITFNDGYEFEKRYRHSEDWKLTRPRQESDHQSYGERIDLLHIELSEDGVENIKAENQEAKRNFHKYRRYISVLLRIFAKISG